MSRIEKIKKSELFRSVMLFVIYLVSLRIMLAQGISQVFEGLVYFVFPLVSVGYILYLIWKQIKDGRALLLQRALSLIAPLYIIYLSCSGKFFHAMIICEYIFFRWPIAIFRLLSGAH